MSVREMEVIFDAFAKASEAIHREDARRKKMADLHEASRGRCGNCIHWMKRPGCPREPGLGSGKHGPSTNSPPCGAFTRERSAELAMAELEKMRAVR